MTMTPEEGKAKAMEVVNYYDAPVARFWLPTLDVAIMAMNKRAAANAMTDTDDGLVQMLYDGDWKTALAVDDLVNAAILGKVLKVSAGALVDIWNQQRQLWEDGKTPDRPSPAILKLTGLNKSSDDKAFAKVATNTVATHATPAGKPVTHPAPPAGPVEHAGSSGGAGPVLGFLAVLAGGALALGGKVRNPRRTRSNPWR
jgi:hypothetical protein